MLTREVMLKNENIKQIDFIGGDNSHSFFYNDLKKSIEIIGRKTTEPDFLITIDNEKSFCIELKTAAVEVFSIKKGNIEQLYKEAAYNNRITLILMIDLENELYSLENLNYFNILQPFSNLRMEGQLCYHFPVPEKNMGYLIKENLDEYLDENIFKLSKVKKLKALKKAEEINDKRFVVIIKNKIMLEKQQENREIKISDFDDKIRKIKEKYPEIVMD